MYIKFVFLEEPAAPDTDLTTLQKTNVTLYDLFIWQHHYAANDNENTRSKLKLINIRCQSSYNFTSIVTAIVLLLKNFIALF